jgi:hypothetical protein
MRIVWDPVKARHNRQKHGVLFSDAEAVLYDPYALTREEEVRGDRRYVTVGLDHVGKVLVVVYSYRNETVSSPRVERSRARDDHI